VWRHLTLKALSVQDLLVSIFASLPHTRYLLFFLSLFLLELLAYLLAIISFFFPVKRSRNIARKLPNDGLLKFATTLFLCVTLLPSFTLVLHVSFSFTKYKYLFFIQYASIQCNIIFGTDPIAIRCSFINNMFKELVLCENDLSINNRLNLLEKLSKLHGIIQRYDAIIRAIIEPRSSDNLSLHRISNDRN